MPIKYNYEVSVNDNKAKLNKDIFLFRGNRNIHYYFSIKGARFAFEKEGDLIENANAIYAAVTVIKPNGVEVANAIAPVENGLIHLKVTEDLIDEEVEIGDFDLVFDLFDDSDGAVTIPKIKGQFHVQERPCTTSIGTLSGNVNVVNQAVVDLAIATQENEQLIVVDDDGKYVKTTWAKGNKISVERLNKMEEGIYNNSSQLKDIAKKIENVGQPTQEQINTAINKAIEDGKVTSGGINSTAKTLLETILKNAIYSTDQSANITSLVSALSSSSGDTPTITYYTITNTLTKCTNGNSNSSVAKNTSYIATIIPNTGYKLDTVTVTMGGVDVTSTVYNNGKITINSVTGNIVIVATAIEKTTSELPTDGLLSYFDLRNKTLEKSGSVYAIQPNQGNGCLWCWNNTTITTSDDYGVNGATLYYCNESVGGKNSNIGEEFTIGTLSYCSDSSNVVYSSSDYISTGNSSIVSAPRYNNTSGSTSKGNLTSIGDGNIGYNVLVLNASNEKLSIFLNSELKCEIKTSDLTDFSSWYDVLNISGLPFQKGRGVGVAIYNKALSEVDCIELSEYMKTLEVNA